MSSLATRRSIDANPQSMQALGKFSQSVDTLKINMRRGRQVEHDHVRPRLSRHGTLQNAVTNVVEIEIDQRRSAHHEEQTTGGDQARVSSAVSSHGPSRVSGGVDSRLFTFAWYL
jgi:hypothetical protein